MKMIDKKTKIILDAFEDGRKIGYDEAVMDIQGVD